MILAPFGVSSDQHLDVLGRTIGVTPDEMNVVVRSGSPSLSATNAGARVLRVELGAAPTQLLRLASAALKVWRLARAAETHDPCVWVDRGWIGPYELLVTAALRVLGVSNWRLVSQTGTVENRSSRTSARTVLRIVGNNVSAVRRVKRAAEVVAALHVPERAARPITRALYVRLDLAMSVSPEPGGSLSHSQGVIGGLQDLGVEVWTAAPLALAAPGRPAPRSVSVDFSPPSNLHPELAEAEFNRHISPQLENLDLEGVDFVYERYSLFGYAGLELAQRLGVPLVLEVNCSEVRFRRQYDTIRFGRSAERFEKSLFEAASLVLAVSQRVVDDITEIAPRARVLLVPNGVDPKLFATDETRRDTVRAALGFGADDVVVGFVGRFYTWHGVETLAEAATSFLAVNPALRLLLVGDGNLKELVERTLEPWADRVHFTGMVEHGEVPGLMSACDVVVSPHAPMKGFIGSPMKIFEYLASGRPLIASRLEQIADVIDDGTTGLLVTPGDAPELSAAVLRLAESPELRQRLGAAGRHSALTTHAWPSKVQAILSSIGDVSPDAVGPTPLGTTATVKDRT